MKHDGGPAYPRSYTTPRRDAPNFERHYDPGMSLRDYFAGQALAGLLAYPDGGAAMAEDDWQRHLSRCAYRYADAMLRQRAKTSTEDHSRTDAARDTEGER